MSSRSNGVMNVRVGALDDLVGRLVGLVLGLAHLLADRRLVGVGVEHLCQEICPEHEVICHLGEEFVERRFNRSDAKTHD